MTAGDPPLYTQCACLEIDRFPTGAWPSSPPKECRDRRGLLMAQRRHGASARSRTCRRPTVNWQPKAVPTQGWRSASRTARSQRSGPADRSQTLHDLALYARAAELRRVFARNNERDRRSRSACLQRTGPKGVFPCISAAVRAVFWTRLIHSVGRPLAGDRLRSPPEYDPAAAGIMAIVLVAVPQVPLPSGTGPSMITCRQRASALAVPGSRAGLS
jgi:hypothetical protein